MVIGKAVGYEIDGWKHKSGAVKICGKLILTPEQPVVIHTYEEGVFTLRILAEPTEKSNFCTVYLDGEETGAFAVPYTGNIDKFARYAPVRSEYSKNDRTEGERILNKYGGYSRRLKELYAFDIPLLLQKKEGKLEFFCRQAWLNGEIKIYNSEGFIIEEVLLLPGIAAPESLFDRIRPGRSMVDLWGWMSMTSFEHPGERVTPYSQQVLRGIREAWPYGANNFEFLPVNKDGMALALKDNEWEGSEVYEQSSDTTWSMVQVQNIIRTAKECGMLTEFFLYCLHGAGFIAKKMQCDQKVALFGKIAEAYGSRMESGDFEELIDGIITEAWYPIEGPRYIENAWKHNPSLFHLISNNDGSQYDVRNAGYTPATHAYSAHWPGFDTQHTGYDHSFPLIPYPSEFYESEEGRLYTYMQGCGQTCHPRKKYPRTPDIPLGITNRTVSPDWIVAQAHNFGLRQLWKEDDHLAMALCWEADEETMCPEEARRYVYAASQDPVRLAACYVLEDTGAGGELELKRVTRQIRPEEVTRIRRRSKYPANTVVNGNRFLQILNFPDRDFSILHCDLSESATFYNNGAVLTIGMPFLITRFEDCRFLHKELHITESAGPLAILEEECRMGSGFAEFVQNCTYTVYSDIPMVKAELRRRMAPGNEADVETIFGLRGYSEVKWEEDVCILTDNKKIMPDAFVFFEYNDCRTFFRPETGIGFAGHTSGNSFLTFRIFLTMGDYKNAKPAEVRRLLPGIEKRISLNGGIQEICNDSGLASPVIVEMERVKQEPCFVEENGLWQHRGIMMSQAHPGNGYVKLYLKPGETGRIRSYGYLENLVRAGRGCQNLLAFENFKPDKNLVSFQVLLSGENPMLPSPVIECAKEVESVRVNGMDYRYFSGKYIFLGYGDSKMQIEVNFGKNNRPVMLSTYGCTKQCSIEEKDRDLYLYLKISKQPWIIQENASLKNRVVLQLYDYHVNSIRGAWVEEKNKDRILLVIEEQEAVIQLEKEADIDGDI